MLELGVDNVFEGVEIYKKHKMNPISNDQMRF